MSVDPTIVDRDERHAGHVGLSVRAILVRCRGADAAEVAADVLDVSLGGAKLIVDAHLLQSEQVELRLTCVESGTAWAIPGVVLWSRPHPRQGWLLGCRFSPPLSPEQLSQLFAKSVVERRKFRRRTLRLVATVDWELGDRGVAVQIGDLADGGFRLISPQPGRIGARVRMTMPDSAPGHDARCISGIVRWQRATKGKWLVGCEFSDRLGFHILRDAVCPASSPEIVEPRQRKGLSTGLSRAASAVGWLLGNRP